MPTVGDVGTVFRAAIVDQDGVPVDLTLATSVLFRLSISGGTMRSRSGVVTNAAGGIVEYATVAGDLDVAGSVYWQVVVTTPSGSWGSSVNTVAVVDRL